MEADVQRKMKLWGVIEAFRDGRLPDNQQIEAALGYAEAHSPVPLEQLSPEGRKLIEDIRDIIGTMREIVRVKNNDEIVQNTIADSYGMDLSHAEQKGVAPTSKQQLQSDADQAGKHLRVLATLFFTNGEVRKLVKDLGLVGRDMFATAAEKAANAARPSQEQLGQVDQAAPDRTWVGADGRTLGPNDSPELQFKAADGSQVYYDPKQAPSQAQVIGNDGSTRTAGEAYNQYQDGKQQAKQEAAQAARSGVQGARTAHAEGHSLGTAAQVGGGAATNTATGDPNAANRAQAQAQQLDASRDPNASYRDQASQLAGAAAERSDQDPQAAQAKSKAQRQMQNVRDKIPEEHRRRMVDAYDDAQNIVKDAFPEERREQFIWRLKKVLVEVQQHKDYYDAMNWLLSAFERYEGYGEHVADKGVAAAQDASSNRQASTVLHNFINVLERFANNQSLQPVHEALNQLYRDSINDPEIRQWWRAVDDFIHRVLLEPGYVMEEQCEEEGRQLEGQGRHFFEGKYKGHWDLLWDRLTAWLKAFNADPLNRRFGDDWKRLTKDILFNEDGNLQFKPKLWNDIRKVILPSAIRHIGYIPIPRAEYTDDKLDLVVENLILSGPNLFPNIITLENHNFFKFSPFDSIKDRNHNRFKLGLDQMQADIRDVRFAFKKKSGFPRISDSGIADVVLSRRGISIEVEVETVEDRPDTVFIVRNVTTSIDELSFKLRDTKHDLLYKFIKGPATAVIKKALSAAVKTAIRAALEHVDNQLVEVRNTVNEAKKSDETTRKEALQSLYKRKKAEAAEVKEKKEPAGEFKIITDRDQSMLPNMSQDSSKSMAGRLWKTEDLARSGRGWGSPAFSLVGDNQHPAITGQAHPGATPGAAQGRGMTALAGQKQENAAANAKERARDAEHKADTAAGVPASQRGTATGATGGHHSSAGAAAGAAAAGAGVGGAGAAAAHHHQQQHSSTGAQGMDTRTGATGHHTGAPGTHTGTTGHHTGATAGTGVLDRTAGSGTAPTVAGGHHATTAQGTNIQHSGDHQRHVEGMPVLGGASGAAGAGAAHPSIHGAGQGVTGQSTTGGVRDGLTGHSTTGGVPGQGLTGHSTTGGVPGQGYTGQSTTGQGLTGHSTTGGVPGQGLTGHSTTGGVPGTTGHSATGGLGSGQTNIGALGGGQQGSAIDPSKVAAQLNPTHQSTQPGAPGGHL